jgi:uncharacterized protein (DUF1800 family)
VDIYPTVATIRGGDFPTTFAADVSNAMLGVTWSVNNVSGGNSTFGTIDSHGVYTPPSSAPSPNTVEVSAAILSDPSVTASAQVTLLNPIPIIYLVTPPVLTPNAAFQLTVTGSKFVSGAQVMFGGLPVATTFLDSSHLSVTGTAPGAGVVPLTVANPQPDGTPSSAASFSVGGVTQRAAVRFLEQSTFGPVPSQLLAVESGGMEAFLNTQLQAAVSPYPAPDLTSFDMTPVQSAFLQNALNRQAGSDQLRQRAVFALNQIWVVSGNKVSKPAFYTPYLQMLAADAFTNYRTIMADVTLNPGMGIYLDMVNNAKPDPVAGTHANENYAREFLQLFTIGPNLLNPDGTPVLQNGNFVATYTQTTIQDMARVFTGWTFSDPNVDCANNLYGDFNNPQAGANSMIVCDSNHDMGAKNILGVAIAPNQTALQDFNTALDIVFNHPNLPPFVAQRFIRNLVTSNPSSAYVMRVANAFSLGTFTSNGITFGSGQRGDMQALLAATLLDAEARRGDSGTTESPVDGHLREPVLLWTNLLRALNTTSDGQNMAYIPGAIGELVLFAPSVFNFYPPLGKIPLSQPPLYGPEFSQFSSASALNRPNIVEGVVFGFLNLAPSTQIDLSTIAGLANDPPTMVEALNQQLLHGTMSTPMRSAILTALAAVPKNNQLGMAQTAVYLIVSSSQYQVQR